MQKNRLFGLSEVKYVTMLNFQQNSPKVIGNQAHFAVEMCSKAISPLTLFITCLPFIIHPNIAFDFD